MKYTSLFAGIGGFDLALNRLGHTCVWANEWDKYATQIYNKNFTQTGRCGQEEVLPVGRGGNTCGKPDIGQHSFSCDTRDIRTVPTSEIPDHDLLVGGFPCQAFSIAGKRRGFDDTRGTLFFEIARILKDKKPSYFILENVKGLLSHDNGSTFKTIISALTELGYDLQWQVLNSKNFGVPQNRERVFIVGHIRGQSRPEVFPIGCNSAEDYAVYEGKREIAQTINATYARNQSDAQYVVEQPQAFRVRSINGVSSTLQGEAGGTGAKTGLYAIPVLTPDRVEKRQNGRRFKENGDPAFTLTSQDIHGVSDGMRIRRLTPTECERLQGFPDGWTEGISDTQRYKCLGNAVTVNVVYEIAKRLQ